MSKYIVVSKVKKRAKELGFRVDNGFLHMMDLLIDHMIVATCEWTKPKKTITNVIVAAYLIRHKIKI